MVNIYSGCCEVVCLPLWRGTAAAKDKTTAARAHRVPKLSLILLIRISVYSFLLHINQRIPPGSLPHQRVTIFHQMVSLYTALILLYPTPGVDYLSRLDKKTSPCRCQDLHLSSLA